MANILHVNVTQEDIDGATPCDGAECPIARAIARQHPEFSAVRVGRHYTTVENQGDGRYCDYRNSPAATTFIETFDHRHTRADVRPSTFHLTRLD